MKRLWAALFTKHRLHNVKNLMFGRKRHHMVEAYTVWVTRVVDGKEYRFRKVYYWYGRKNSPFNRRHGKGIQICGIGILEYATFDAYIDDVQFSKYMDDVGKAIDAHIAGRRESRRVA